MDIKSRITSTYFSPYFSSTSFFFVALAGRRLYHPTEFLTDHALFDHPLLSFAIHFPSLRSNPFPILSWFSALRSIFHTQQWLRRAGRRNRCSGRGRCMETQLPALLRNYDRQTDRPSNQQTDMKGHREVPFLIRKSKMFLVNTSDLEELWIFFHIIFFSIPSWVL